MSTPDELIQLIVCSDQRAGELARILSAAGTVYRRWSEDKKAWAFTLFDQSRDRWVTIDSKKVPGQFDILYFHTGEGDPDGIPTDGIFVKEFAFSTGTLPSKGPYGGRQAAIAIRRFPAGDCPVKKRHLPELTDFLRGARTELPTFCRRDETLPTLWSLAILIQAYAAAGIAYGDISASGSFATAVGWNRLKTDHISRLSKRLADHWTAMQRMEWWRVSLGISDDAGVSVSETKSRFFLAQLIQDLELDVPARHKLGLPAEARLSEQRVDGLLKFLEKQSDVSSIVDLLKAERAETMSVENAYKQVKGFLEQK